MNIVRTDTLFGSKKNIVGSTSSDLVLETLGKVYIKTGKSTKTLTEILSEYSKSGTTQAEGNINQEQIAAVLSEEYLSALVNKILLKNQIFGEFVTLDSVKNKGNENLPVYFNALGNAETITGLQVKNKIETESEVVGLLGVSTQGISDLSIYGGYNVAGVVLDILENYTFTNSSYIDQETLELILGQYKGLQDLVKIDNDLVIGTNNIPYITEIQQNPQGVISVTIGSLPIATASQIGLLSYEQQIIGGEKTFTSVTNFNSAIHAANSIDFTSNGYNEPLILTSNKFTIGSNTPNIANQKIPIDINSSLSHFFGDVCAEGGMSARGIADLSIIGSYQNNSSAGFTGLLHFIGDVTGEGNTEANIRLTIENSAVTNDKIQYPFIKLAGTSITLGTDISLSDLQDLLGVKSLITSAMKIEGTTTTDVITNSTTSTVVISSENKTAYNGMVVFYQNKEFVWVDSAWKELGDESSFALKGISITGTGYLTGGGTLESDRTIDINQTYKDYINEGHTARGYFDSNGILKTANMSHSNIISALGNNPVNRATGDKNGLRIDTNYLKLDGSNPMTGTLTLRTNGYKSNSEAGLDCKNSDIVNINSIYTGDLSEDWKESIAFYRTSTAYDTFRASSGIFYFGFNNQHTSNATSGNEYVTLTDREFKIERSDRINNTAIDTSLKVTNYNGSISLLTSTNRGVYDSSTSTWLIATNGTNSFLNRGNVGIGTVTPGVKLDVVGDIRASQGVYSGGIYDLAINLYNAGVLTGTLQYQSGGGMWCRSRDNCAIATTSVANNSWHPVIGARVSTGHWSAGAINYEDNSHKFVVAYAPDSSYNTNNVGVKLFYFPYSDLDNGSTNYYTLSAAGSGTSDIRLKTNIESITIEKSKEIINQLRPVTFKWRDEAEEYCKDLFGNDIGLIAQEVEKIIPSAVMINEFGYKKIEYGKLVAPLIKVSQEYEERISQLEKEVQYLKEENSYLKDRLK